MIFFRSVALLAPLVFVSPATCLADDAPFARRIVVKAVAVSNELIESTTTEDIEIKSQAVVKTFGQIILPVNEHFFDLEILEAATIKADGRREPVASDKILVSTLPNSATLGIFEADVKVRMIVFPDVTAGDTVHYVARFREKARGLSGGFSFARVIPPSARYAEASGSLDAPKDLALHVTAVGFSEKSEERDGRLITTWTLDPQPYRADEAGSTALFDRDPHILVSSYPDWDTIGRSFLKGAGPVSAPTPEIRALAEEITKGAPDRREQARAIFDWVSKNVRYMAIFLGQGGFVPHEAASVLVNKYGDCKDHATLMRALLTAKGIESEYALISLLPIYQDYETPSPDWFNHVILYLPEFDLYADPTANLASFDSLPDNETDKPVLRTGDHGVTMARTPALSAATNRVTIRSDATLRPDGTVQGTAVTETAGPISWRLRSAVDEAAATGAEEYAKKLLAAQNWRGAGSIELSDPADRTEPYVVKSSFDLTNKFFGEGPNDNALPLGPKFVSPAFDKFRDFFRKEHTQNFVCEAETYEQFVDFHLPEGQLLADIPDGLDMDGPLASYKSSYSLRGTTLHVERRFVSRVPGQVCTPEMAKQMEPLIEAARKDYGYRPQFKN